jgi:hypothetical protein
LARNTCADSAQVESVCGFLAAQSAKGRSALMQDAAKPAFGVGKALN